MTKSELSCWRNIHFSLQNVIMHWAGLYCWNSVLLFRTCLFLLNNSSSTFTSLFNHNRSIPLGKTCGEFDHGNRISFDMRILTPNVFRSKFWVASHLTASYLISIRRPRLIILEPNPVLKAYVFVYLGYSETKFKSVELWNHPLTQPHWTGRQRWAIGNLKKL